VPNLATDPERAELHQLLDRIPAEEVPAARRFLESLADPLERALLNAALDDEPETDEEKAAVKAALADPAEDLPFEQVRRRK
jgi:hypothetical protein